jgi:predicted site-specific integrase-resolvase
MPKRENSTVRKGQGMNNPMLPRLLPLKKASEIMGLSVWALRERIWAGDIPVVQFKNGRKQWIDVSDIERFIADNKKVMR